jgi:hypothetical protein
MPHLAHALQTKRVVNDPHDRHEQEADHVARRVMNSVSTDPHPDLAVRSPVAPFAPSTGGAPLAPAVRAFMEPRFGVDFSQVRVHTDAQAAQINEQLQARAFTHQGAIYFGAGQRPGNDPLTAHELAHVVQQGGGPSAAGGAPPAIQRAIELRPPGRGEASAFGRAQELIDRLNLVSGGLEFRLEGRALLYTVRDEAALTHFDRQMRAFIDREQLVPMRLLTHRGRVRGAGGTFVPLLADSFIAAYVDLDDLMADDEYSFQSDLLHFLTERFQVRDYARLIGTDFSAQFPRAHRAGKDAEAAFLQDLLNDATIRFNYEETRPNGNWVNAFKSNEGYRVFQVVRAPGREIAGGEMFVHTRNGRRLTIDEFRAERAAAAP